MKFEDSAIWDDPFIKDLRKTAQIDLGVLNKSSILRILMDNDSLDPLTAGAIIAKMGMLKNVPPRIQSVLDIISSDRLQQDGPHILFKAEDTAALNITLAAFVNRFTGPEFENTKALLKTDAGRELVQKNADLMAQVSDLMVETGAHLAVEPKLVARFIESLDNMREQEPFSTRRKALNEASAALKYAMMRGAANEVTHHAPRVDPDTRLVRLKNQAKTRFKL